MPASVPDRPKRSRQSIVAVALFVNLVAATAAIAGFTSIATESQSVSSGTLAAPTAVGASVDSCSALTSVTVRVSWTATTSTFADGYEIFRSTGGGAYASAGTVSGAGATTFVDTGVTFSTSYAYRVQATRNAWRSPDSNTASITTPSILCV